MFFTLANKRLFSTATSLRQYPFLKTLGLTEANPGVYRAGQWVNGGGVNKTSYNPHNNQDIASVQMGNATDFNDCIEAMDSEQ